MRRVRFGDQSFLADPFPVYRSLREQGPVIRSPVPLLGNVALLTTYAAGSNMLKRHEEFVVDARKVGEQRASGLKWWVPRTFRPLADNLLAHDSPEHRRLRSLVDQAFHRRSVETYESRIVALADELLDTLEAAPEHDPVEHYARALPLTVICELLGLPELDRGRFIGWLRALNGVNSPAGIFRALPAVRALSGYLRGQFEARRQAPRDDLVTSLVQASDAGDCLSEDEILAMCFLLFLAGHDTTTHLIAGATLALLDHPHELERLQSDWSQVPAAVDELLRFVSPVLLTRPRFAIADTEIAGETIHRGESVCVLVGAVNTDPETFNKPETLDIGRERNLHLGFGSGPHTCLGLLLARLETRIALERLFARYPRARLAGSREAVRWQGRTGLRALRALPLALH